METIQTDNESFFKGAAFKKAMADLGIQPTLTLPSAPPENGRLERFFRQTEAHFLKQWQDRQDRPNKPLSLDAFYEELKKFFEDYNSRLPGSTPTAD
ncbi:MAG: hypothetical protein M3Z64_05475 [Verrucomicrobiota bacterium]|nr:hypothetical protein [Verrucomicrobiota bacterium]